MVKKAGFRLGVLFLYRSGSENEQGLASGVCVRTRHSLARTKPGSEYSP